MAALSAAAVHSSQLAPPPRRADDDDTALEAGPPTWEEVATLPLSIVHEETMPPADPADTCLSSTVPSMVRLGLVSSSHSLPRVAGFSGLD